MTYGRKDILDAMTSDSSMDGCDPDWRREVLFNSSQKDRNFVARAISIGPSSLDDEIRGKLIKDGKI